MSVVECALTSATYTAIRPTNECKQCAIIVHSTVRLYIHYSSSRCLRAFCLHELIIFLYFSWPVR